jgi:hypothetical protein
MSDGTQGTDNWGDLAGLLPHDLDDDTSEQDKGEGKFLSQPLPLTARGFADYVARYDFGSIPPDYIVLHHSANPATLFTQGPAQAAFGKDLHVYDAGEAGKSEDQIQSQRLQAILAMRKVYEGKGWQTGPHLFIDDRWIWVFSTMYDAGIHAMWGNFFTDPIHGKYHYSIGIEVIGYYEKQQWPPAVAALVRAAVTTLQKQLKTFELRYLYPTEDSKPGRIGEGSDAKVAHRERLRWGGITSHRDYNKPWCPGAAITEQYYINVLNGT